MRGSDSPTVLASCQSRYLTDDVPDIARLPILEANALLIILPFYC